MLLNYQRPYPNWLVEDLQDTIEDLEIPEDITEEQLLFRVQHLRQEAHWAWEECNRKEMQADYLEFIALNGGIKKCLDKNMGE